MYIQVLLKRNRMRGTFPETRSGKTRTDAIKRKLQINQQAKIFINRFEGKGEKRK